MTWPVTVTDPSGLTVVCLVAVVVERSCPMARAAAPAKTTETRSTRKRMESLLEACGCRIAAARRKSLQPAYRRQPTREKETPADRRGSAVEREARASGGLFG